jgi:predicted permease
MLAVGIGVSTAVFSVLSPVLLNPFGLWDGHRLIEVFRTTQGHLEDISFTFETGLSEPELRGQREGNGPLKAMTMASKDRFEVRAPGRDARFVTGSFISSGYCEVLGVEPVLGRRLAALGDQVAGAGVLISHALWATQFDGNPDAVGKELWVNGHPCVIEGVFPRSFSGHVLGERTDVWVAEGGRSLLDPGSITRLKSGLMSTWPTLARLQPGATLAQARAALLVTGSPFQPALRTGITVSPISVRPAFHERRKVLEERLPAPWVLLSVAGILLVLACANVTNLQLAQMEARRQEFAARLALGARSSAIFRQVIGENLVIGALASLLGLGLTIPMLRILEHIKDVKAYGTPLPAELSASAILFALFLSGLCALATALPPAMKASREDLNQLLKAGSGTLAYGSRVRDGLVVLQVGLALALVTSGTLLTRSLDQARTSALGFKTAGVGALRVEFMAPGRRNEDILLGIQERLRALPGIRATALANGLPMETGSKTISNVGNLYFQILFVGPDYFRTLGIPVLKGREFLTSDLAPVSRVAIVNQALARKVWPDEDPVGMLTRKDGKTVVGVVVDHGVEQGKSIHEPVLFLPRGSMLDRAGCLLFQMDGKPEALFPLIRHMVRDADPDLPILQLGTLAEHLDGLYHDLRVASWLLGFCGIVSLCLSAMGVQSLLAFRVTRQTRDIGLRMALGAG